MPTTCSGADLRVVEGSLAAADGIAAAGAISFCLTNWWWRSMIEAGVAPDGQARFLVCAAGTTPIAVLPLLVSAGGRRVESLAGPYTCLFQPLFAPGLDEAVWRRVGAAFARHCRRGPPVRLDALDEAAPWLAPFLAGARESGLHAVRFEHFGNWSEAVTDWAAYYRARPGDLRETIRRRMRRAGLAFELVGGGPTLDAGIADYEDVYARSWKVPEPFPAFNAAMMRHAAAAGALRLGLLRIGGTVIAAQIWIVSGNTATVVKLAHDEAHKALSPGTVLTAHMIRRLLDEEPVETLDFGRGDDAYKRLWAGRRRQRVGVVLADPWRPAGAAVLLRHRVGQLRRRWLARP